MGVIWVLWWRQLVRFQRSRARVLAALGQPLLFLGAFGFGFAPVFRQAGQGDYLQFLAPGVIGMGTLFSAVFAGIELIWDRQFGFIKETLVAPVPRWQVMAGRTLGGATVAVVQGLLVALVCTLAGFRATGAGAWLAGVGYLALVALLFTSIGTMIASLVEDFHAFPLVMNFLVMPLFFLSGAMFPLRGLGPALAAITRANPLSYGMDGLRGALTGAWQFSPVLDAGLLAGLAAVALVVGTVLFNRIEA